MINNLNIIDLVIFSKFENSKSEIRRLIKGKAIKINMKVIELMIKLRMRTHSRIIIF